MKSPYRQLSVKFPTGKERYRQALECINARDRGRYKTLADYITSAVLFFEGNISDERTGMEQILQAVKAVEKKADEILYEQKKRG